MNSANIFPIRTEQASSITYISCSALFIEGWADTKGPNWVPLGAVKVSDGVVLPSCNINSSTVGRESALGVAQGEFGILGLKKIF